MGRPFSYYSEDYLRGTAPPAPDPPGTVDGVVELPGTVDDGCVELPGTLEGCVVLFGMFDLGTLLPGVVVLPGTVLDGCVVDPGTLEGWVVVPGNVLEGCVELPGVVPDEGTLVRSGTLPGETDGLVLPGVVDEAGCCVVLPGCDDPGNVDGCTVLPGTVRGCVEAPGFTLEGEDDGELDGDDDGVVV